MYDLILNDNTLSEEKRKAILEHHSQDYTDDTAFADLIYDALLLSMTRKYKKESGEKVYHVVSSEKIHSQNVCLAVTDFSGLFANSEYEEPCDSFCGRDEELSELHDLVKKKSKVMVVGVKSVGKSELVRAYIQKYSSEYDHIGYYYYNISKSDSFRPKNIWHTISEINGRLVNENAGQTEYNDNLILLSSLGKKALLVIDSFNVPANYDKNFTDIMRLKCDVILISHMNYDNMTVYKLRNFRRFKDAYALLQYYYSFKLNGSVESEMHRLASLLHRNPYLLDICGKHLAKGLATPYSLGSVLCKKDYHNMKARISTKKGGQFQEKADYYNLLMKILNTNDLSDTEKYVLSYMRFIPEEGIRKLLFADLISLEDINIIEELIDRGILQEHKGGCIYMPSIIADIVETEIPVIKEQFAMFADKVYHLSPDSAPKSVLSQIADNMSAPEYMEIYETDRFYAVHMEYQFNYKLGDEFDTIEGAEKLKSEVDFVDERLHSGMPLFSGKIFRITKENAEILGLSDDE